MNLEVFPISEKSENNSFTSAALYHQAVDQIGRYWRSLLHEDSTIDCEEAYGVENRRPAWFGDLKSWLKPLYACKIQSGSGTKNTEAQQKYQRQFSLPSAVNTDLAMISIELDTMLPKDNPLVAAMLPILIYSYFLNRKKQGEAQFDADGYPIDEVSLQGTAKLFVDLKTNAWQDYTLPHSGKDPLLNRAKKLFNLKNWRCEYSKLTLNSLQNEQKQGQIRRIFGKILLFSTLTYHLQDVCNVTMTMDAFEDLTGLLSLITKDLPIHTAGKSEGPFRRNLDPCKQELLALIEQFQIEHLQRYDTIPPYVIFLYLLRNKLWYSEHEDEGRDPTEDERKMFTKDFPDLIYLLI